MLAPDAPVVEVVVVDVGVVDVGVDVVVDDVDVEVVVDVPALGVLLPAGNEELDVDEGG